MVTAEQAVDLVERAEKLARRGYYVKAIEQFERAVELDPNFAEAWAELALARSILGFSMFSRRYRAQFPKAREAAQRALEIDSRLEVELYETMPLDFLVEEHALHFPFAYRPQEYIGLSPYLEPAYPDHAAIAQWLEPYRNSPLGTETFSVLDRMNSDIHFGIGYEVREEEGVLAPAETLRRGKGSCRDLAALFLESCRRLGIAARFVSGYVHVPATEAGGATTHAWTEVYIPGAGWKGFDPTNAVVVGPDHIPVAVHRDPEAVPPVAGSFTGPGGLTPVLSVDVQINRIGKA